MITQRSPFERKSMPHDFIGKKVEKIKRKHKGLDIYSLCDALKIMLHLRPLGNSPQACKGFYLIQSRIQIIVINSDLCEMLRRCILAHELGHALLHHDAVSMKAFHDFQLFDTTTKFEYEANIFASELLLEHTEVLELLNGDMSFFAAAATLGVPPELLDFKFRTLKRQGYKVVDPPFTATGDFLKKLHNLEEVLYVWQNVYGTGRPDRGA